MKSQPFARSKDDEAMNKKLKEIIRSDDPMVFRYDLLQRTTVALFFFLLLRIMQKHTPL